MNEDLPNIDIEQIQPIDIKGLAISDEDYHPPQDLMLCQRIGEASIA